MPRRNRFGDIYGMWMLLVALAVVASAIDDAYQRNYGQSYFVPNPSQPVQQGGYYQ